MSADHSPPPRNLPGRRLHHPLHRKDHAGHGRAPLPTTAAAILAQSIDDDDGDDDVHDAGPGGRRGNNTVRLL
ncbi:hypothetical protein EMPG_16952 [Blastomyces silverae]|uniref:Uncharacterized protein n=1 Tax=Blastomyces silverae TaxID=2060906 RepID=A0A0H1B818_9EURO|nr:hypothetical protein EMPG_16952 [Blastomyces silverae]